MKKYLLFSLLGIAFLTGCQHRTGAGSSSADESKEAKALLQGIWLDAENDEVSFRVKGDSVFFPDSTSLPAYFKIVSDTFIVGDNHYPILKQASHLFWFKNQTGDIVKLVKSDDPNDVLDFMHKQPTVLSSLTEVVKTDSVVMYDGERYHWYIAINPTKYRVTKSSYNDDGLEVDNVYYDNIIHISIFHKSRQLFSSDLKKQLFGDCVPEQFLEQAVLGNMQFGSVDKSGFHFEATLCVPDGATCYLVSTDIGFDGQLSMKLLEY